MRPLSVAVVCLLLSTAPSKASALAGCDNHHCYYISNPLASGWGCLSGGGPSFCTATQSECTYSICVYTMITGPGGKILAIAPCPGGKSKRTNTPIVLANRENLGRRSLLRRLTG